MSYTIGLACLKCKTKFPLDKLYEGCPQCKTDEFISNLDVSYNYDQIADILTKSTLTSRHDQGVWKYHELLPISDQKHMITLGEGETPLVKCDRLGKKLGLKNLYIKDESRNPTWSFKDRLCCVAIAKGLEFNALVATALSTGNHGAATAAYAAKAGMDCVIFTLPYVPQTMLTLMQAYGAKILTIASDADKEFGVYPYFLLEKCVKEHDWYPTSAYTLPPTGNPYGVEGYKTVGYEIFEQLGWEVPDRIFLPSGYGACVFSTWKAARELTTLDFIDHIPPVIAVEPTASGPLTNALQKGLDYVELVPTQPTVAFSIGVSTSTYGALRAVIDSGGTTVQVTDDEIMEMQLMLGKYEGLYAESSSAASVAGVKKLKEIGDYNKDELIVCVLSGGGLKDPVTTQKYLPSVPTIRSDWSTFIEVMRDHYSLTF